jgi:glyoxylate reductase
MALPKVLVTRKIPSPAIAKLAEHFDVDENADDRPYPPAELAQRAAAASAVITLLSDRIDETFLSAARELQVVANCAVGYDNIDVAAAKRHGVIVTNTPGVLTDATADFAFTLVLAVARRIVEADRYVREGKFSGWMMMEFLGGDLAGRTMGIAGFGRIGQGVARRARGFGMDIIYSDDQPVHEDVVREYAAREVDKATLLEQSDVLSLHVPLLPSTRHYIGEAELVRMKRSAYLINTSRGPVIDELALARALRDGVIAGAGLDVFEREPAVDPLLATLPNAVLAPHIASATFETRTKMAMMAAENAIAVLAGKPPLNPV